MARKLLVTSALPYSNGPIHIGHLAGAYLPADIFVRYQRMSGNDVVFICGADEHGVPITIAAAQQGITPQELVDKYYPLNRDSFAGLRIEFDNFSRTSLPLHRETSQEFFLTLHKRGKLTVKNTKQLYCPRDKMFLADRYVTGECPTCGSVRARGDQCEQCGAWLDALTLKLPRCAICGATPVIEETMHWYLPMGQFQKKLEAWLSEKKDWKDNVLNYCRGWFKEGLRDRAITRDLDWGVPVPLPEGAGKVLYVWFDAPIGYISATKEWAAQQGDHERWREYWCNPDCEIIHFIGKDNIVFHALFWPATLMEVGGYTLPSQVPANEFLNLQGRKLSTSQNYAVWVPDYLERFPADILRYTLASNLPETKDADFSWKQFQSCNNDELADILGNFVNRTLTFIMKYLGGKIPPAGAFSADDTRVLAEVRSLGAETGRLINRYKIRAATERMMDIAREGNRYFDAQQPWRTRKTDKHRCNLTLHICCQIIRALAVYSYPFIPDSAERMWRQLGLPGEPADCTWKRAAKPADIAGIELEAPEILFKKLEDKDIQPELDRLAVAVAAIEEHERQQAIERTNETRAAEEYAATALAQVTIDEFAKMDLRVATVTGAEAIPKAKKLLKLTLDLGTETRQVVAGIAGHYAPEEVIGRQVICVANLVPVTLRGVESQGMVLCADDGKALVLTTVAREIGPGSTVR
jgi:methionyl-tRNA synthetase